MEETLIDRQEIAAQLGVSVRTVDRMRERGELAWVPVAERLVRFRPQVTSELVAAREKTTGEPKPERMLAPLRPLPRGRRRFLPPVLERARRDHDQG